ncbi:Hypothetical predicted protein [Olea europaea subsp. europaea]|uniref:Uncharacterized protein n=1 Tax=Olea europaea subsp. europaea TaxID=158383 RepID=A0A8S0UKD4_OLEEU|nr:Hypothetical predicted protein [Olea europaea subsp. europaea]
MVIARAVTRLGPVTVAKDFERQWSDGDENIMKLLYLCGDDGDRTRGGLDCDSSGGDSKFEWWSSGEFECLEPKWLAQNSRRQFMDLRGENDDFSGVIIFPVR